MPSVDLSDVRMHYELSGTGDPLLLIPGLGQTCRNFDPLVDLLAPHYCIVQIDNRGIGRSIAKRPPRRIQDYACDCLELLDALQLDRAHILGISFGGVLAQNFAADHPSRTNRLILISTTDRFHPYLRQVAKTLGFALRRFPMRLFFQTMELMSNAPEFFDAHEAEILQSIPKRAGDRSLKRTISNQLRCLASAECATSNAKIQSPTLVITGEYDALIPRCYGRQMAADIPGSELAMIPNCGHNPVTENPDALAELVQKFLDKPVSAANGVEFVSTPEAKQFSEQRA